MCVCIVVFIEMAEFVFVFIFDDEGCGVCVFGYGVFLGCFVIGYFDLCCFG